MTNFETFYYEDGNAARKYAEALPNRETRQRELREERERNRRRTHARNMRQIRANRMQAVCLAVGIFLLGGAFAGYVHLQNTITASKNNISSLEQELSDLKASNSAAESRIATATSLETVKNTALNELGMVYATSDQIVYYSISDEDYMNQYTDIP